MRIAEIFRSIQGEGRLTGTESVFVRTSGCNLRCAYCDTPYASWMPEGEDLSVDEILARVEELAAEEMGAGSVGRKGERHRGGDVPPTAMPTGATEPVPVFPSYVVITGGEPMLFAELIPLCAALRRQGRHITIETAGTLYLPVACDLMSISPKLSNSSPPPQGDPRWTWRHETNRTAPEVVRRLVAEYDYQVKFVVDNLADCAEAEQYLAAFPEIDRARAMLMPQGTDAADLAEKGRWLEPYCRAHDLGFCPRRHIEWFGSRRGT